MSASASAAGEPSPEENSDPSSPSTTGRVAAAAGIMVAAVLASRVLALVRDMVVSYYFGAGMTTDAYKAAFSLPDLLYYLIAGGALSSAFIPVFTEYLTRGDEDGAWHIFSVFGTVLVVVLSLVVGLGEIFTEWLILPLCPGFTPQKLALAVSLTRIILPAQIFFFVGGLM
ncbi:MAG TPA: lipid II flippase MurJ, partial [Armatimonadota bacterium]|nr:lipid II flippase MurJ [Armatimonadota bacterium]